MDVKQLEEFVAKFNQISRDNRLASAAWDSRRWLVNSQKSGAEGNNLKLLCIQAARAKGYSGPDPLDHCLDFIKECGFNYFETKNGSVSLEDGVIRQADTGEIVNLADACARACLALLGAPNVAMAPVTSHLQKLQDPDRFPWMTAKEAMKALGRHKTWVYENVEKNQAGMFLTRHVKELIQPSED
jgi:hypothetical protein